MTVTIIEFPTQYGMKRVEVSEQFLTNVKKFFTSNGISSLKNVKTIVTGYDRIDNLPDNEMKFEYADEWYSGESCYYGIAVIDGRVDYILCSNDQSEAFLYSAFPIV